METCVLVVKILKKLTTTDILIKKDDKQVVNYSQIYALVEEANSVNTKRNQYKQNKSDGSAIGMLDWLNQSR